MCGPSSSRSPGEGEGCVIWASLGDSFAFSIDYLFRTFDEWFILRGRLDKSWWYNTDGDNAFLPFRTLLFSVTTYSRSVLTQFSKVELNKANLQLLTSNKMIPLNWIDFFCDWIFTGWKCHSNRDWSNLVLAECYHILARCIPTFAFN